MTDDEIDAAIAAVTAILPDGRDRAIYRAGMMRAAEIAREHEFARTAAAAIERAAGARDD